MKPTTNISSEQELIINNTAIGLGPSLEDMDGVLTSKTSSFVKRLFNNDGRRFRKFVHSTTTHGIIHIFSGKSKIRRFLWLVLVVTSATGCLYDIIKSVHRLTRGSTDTTVSVVEPDTVDFPAVTLCNLNIVRRSYLENLSSGVRELIENAPYVYDSAQQCNKKIKNFTGPLNESFPNLLWNGRHTAEDTIFRCKFKGQACTYVDFTQTLMPSGGVCYTFNGERGPSIRKTNGTGTRFALSLIINVQQHEYIAALNQDVGIKIAVHPQSELPQPDDLGIAIPPGKNAFVSVRRLNVTNKSTRRKCRDVQDSKSFRFLRNMYSYSESVCEIDCLMSNIAQNCGCLGPGTPAGASGGYNSHNLQNCTIGDICCQIHNATISTCDCRVACETTMYITETSYSAFPANYAMETFFEEVQQQYQDTSRAINISNRDDFLRENFLGVNVYFETLTVEEQTTHNSYDAITMLSDIGGQLALFLGASVISILEFFAWIFDEVKDRFLGISERKILSKVKPAVMARKMKRTKVEALIHEECVCNEGDSGIGIEMQGIDYTEGID